MTGKSNVFTDEESNMATGAPLVDTLTVSNPMSCKFRKFLNIRSSRNRLFTVKSRSILLLFTPSNIAAPRKVTVKSRGVIPIIQCVDVMYVMKECGQPKE